MQDLERALAMLLGRGEIKAKLTLTDTGIRLTLLTETLVLEVDVVMSQTSVRRVMPLVHDLEVSVH